MQTDLPDSLSRTFAALADPTRRAMLARLSKGQASVSDLAQPFLKDMTLPAATKHLKVLERAGLVTKTREAQWRPCTLNGAPMKDAVAWMEQYREFWKESLDRLGEYLKTLTPEDRRAASTKAKGKGKRDGRKK
jgi:DNA-binding transcriptional ArsR family regulator